MTSSKLFSALTTPVSVVINSLRKLVSVQNTASYTDQKPDQAVLLFENGGLLDASVLGRLVMTLSNALDQKELGTFLVKEFQGFAKVAQDFDTSTAFEFESTDFQMSSQRVNNVYRITLSGPWIEKMDLLIGTKLADAKTQTKKLQSITNTIPHALWVKNKNGDIEWSNAAFAQFDGKKLTPNIFGENFKVTADKKRVSALAVDAQEDWFDVETHPFSTGVLQVALNANKAVVDEAARAEFVQTLTKTFAQLSTALIIFDKSRNLALFNPALMDMTNLPFEFLSQRPHLYSFLDRLREDGIVPEPKDYNAWREQMAELESAAEDGTYCETWDLANGQTFRITGRPHPNGAIAFLMEDISNEVSLARKFRYEIDLTRKVLDTLEEAIAIFSETGSMVAANEAYVDLWGVDPESSILEVSVTDCLKTWLDKASPNPAWGDLRDFLSQTAGRSEWQTDVQLRAGRVYKLRCIPLAGGATVVGFSEKRQQKSSIKPLDNDIPVAAVG